MTEEEHRGVVNTVVDASQKLLTALPPAFLMLLAINTIFIGIVFWHLDRAQDARAEVLNRIIDHCLK